jgi:hypothetical protein
MISLVWGGRRLPSVVLAAGLGIWAFAVSQALADDGGTTIVGQRAKGPKSFAGLKKKPGPGCGTLGYGPPGPQPGFQGFGLGYHPGYGYGGAALGVGAEGGYPLYGGPGYPHPWPTLRRLGAINPFPYFGGPGYPSPDHPNYFGGVGPLVPDRPVVTVESDPGQLAYTGDYGCFTGTLPYPESTFAPYATVAGTGGTSSGVSSGSTPSIPSISTPTTSGISGGPAVIRPLGIETESIVDSDRAKVLKVTRVSAESATEKAGLHAGDVIRSINGYLTEQPGNLPWIVANAAPDGVLRVSVRTAVDGEVRSITVRLP